MSNSPKIAIVTGANNGIGFETAVGLAEAGFRVVMACRNLKKAESARQKLIRRVPAIVDVLRLDLSRPESVREFAEQFRAKYRRLNVLVNNAGILLYSHKRNDDRIELQFATNHLGHFLLTCLLMDMMPDDPATRVVSMSSIAHKGAAINFDDLTCHLQGRVAYGQSKLACLMFGDELDRRLRAAGSKIKSLTVHPGGSDSGLFEEMGWGHYFILKMLAPVISHSNAAAAKSSLHAALAKDVEGGDYFGPTGIMELRGNVGKAKRDPNSTDQEVARRLWKLSEHLVGCAFDLSRSKNRRVSQV